MGFNSERGDAGRCEKGEMRGRMMETERRCWVAGVGELNERRGGEINRN